MKASQLYNKIQEQTKRTKVLEEKIQFISAKGNWDTIKQELPAIIQEHIQILEEQQQYLQHRAKEKPWHRFFYWLYGEPQETSVPELRS